MSKVAVVTGGNKGIGFAIVKGLCQRYDGIVYLTARDIGRGEQAVKELESIGLHPKFHQLDVTDQKSIEVFRDYLKSTHSGIDILVNNAAIAFKGNAPDPVAVQAEETMRVNYFSLLSVCNELLPLVKTGGRVVNLSSSCGRLNQIPSPQIQAQFGSKNLTVEELNALVNKYVETAKKGKTVEDGWGNSSYVVSKVAVSALTFIHQRQWDSKGIIVNCVHPGYVDTDMTSHKGNLKPDEGARSTLYAALDAPNSLKGAFIWHNNETVNW